MLNLKKYNFRLVDFLGIGVFILVLVVSALFLRRSEQYLTIVLKVAQFDNMDDYGSQIPQWFLENLKVGTKQMTKSGKLETEILKVYSQNLNEKSKEFYVTMKVSTAYDRKSKIYSYQGLPVLVGSFQNFKIDGILLKGMVVAMNNGDHPLELNKFEIEGYLNPVNISNQDPFAGNMISNGVTNYLADRFKVGETMTSGTGENTAKIIEVKLTPATRRFVSGNKIVEVLDTERKRVWLKLEVEAEKINNVNLFAGIVPIRINNEIYLDFVDFGAKMTITDFKEI